LIYICIINFLLIVVSNICKIFLSSTFLIKFDVGLQELWDERDGLLGRGEHALQREEEQHAGQDTRQEEGLGVQLLRHILHPTSVYSGTPPPYTTPYIIVFLTEKKI
jgi:hypothetical protein